MSTQNLRMMAAIIKISMPITPKPISPYATPLYLRLCLESTRRSGLKMSSIADAAIPEVIATAKQLVCNVVKIVK